MIDPLGLFTGLLVSGLFIEPPLEMAVWDFSGENERPRASTAATEARSCMRSGPIFFDSYISYSSVQDKKIVLINYFPKFSCFYNNQLLNNE
jgi:hypothetical protein